MPPEMPSDQVQVGDASPAVSFVVSTMKKRKDFLATARGEKRHKTGFVLQARRRGEGSGDDSGDDVRVGFTCTKRVGNAVARNRAKRRLREAARAAMPTFGRPGWDYVLIGRAEKTARQPFDALVRDLSEALGSIHT